MYQVLFIDDKFEEIENTFLELQKHHVRCFFSNADENKLSKLDKVALKDVKYICLDYHLENRGINASLSSAVSMSILVNILTEHKEELEGVTIILNTTHSQQFEDNREDFEEALKLAFGNELNYKLDVEGKTYEGNEIVSDAAGEKEKPIKNNIESNPVGKFDAIRKKYLDKILKETIIQSLKNEVISGAIEIENLILEKLLESIEDKKQHNDLTQDLLTQLKFSQKIHFFNSHINDKYKKQLKALRCLRNNLAHNNYEKDEKHKELKKDIKNFLRLWDSEYKYNDKQVVLQLMNRIDDLHEKISKVNLKDLSTAETTKKK